MKGSLPIFVVDNEIYRYLPAVLVGTVDKLAIISRNQAFAHIVRGANQRCASHGYASYDECVEQRVGCKATKRNLQALPALKDPGLSMLIQDELHLLKAELGVFNGHYEGLLRFIGGKVHLPPKVLAATATIEAYDVQTYHIYLSRATRFPQPGWQLGESFYATSTPRTSRRRYVGIRSHTRSIEEPALRALAIYFREIRRLQANPRMAAQIVKREDATDAQVLDLLRLYDLSLAYVNRKATGGNLIDKLKRIDRMLALENLPPIEGRPLTGDQGMDEVGATLERIERERADTSSPRLNIVAATSLISHGVDLERINMMLVCGLPSHYAEYVQSTSRAARTHPGLVFVCFNARQPRELSQFEFFYQMHEHMDRLIEAVAVNRFASFAPKKTVPGLVTGLLLSHYTPLLFGRGIQKSLGHLPTLQTALGLRDDPASTATPHCVSREELSAAVKEIIGVDRVHPPATRSQVEHLRLRIDGVLNDVYGSLARTMERYLPEVLDLLTSFRDVDEGIDFYSTDAPTIVPKLRAR